MTTGKDIKARLQSYIDALASGDVDRVMSHYARFATCEDPVGGPVHKGIDAIRAFYTSAMSAGQLKIEPISPIVSTTDECAAVAARVKLPGGGLLHFIEVQRYNEQGKIVQMRAYYDPADIAPAK